jgi:hypothetical protein
MPGRLHEFGETLREIGGTLDPRNERTQFTLAGIIAVVVIIAALFALPGSSHTKSRVEAQGDAAAQQAAASAGDNGSTTSKAGSATNTKGGAGGSVGRTTSAAAGGQSLNPNLELEYTRKLAAMIKPVSTSLPNGNPNTWVGVTKDKIKFIFSYDKSNCGVNLINALSAAGANFSTEGRYYRAAPKNSTELNAQTVEAVNAIVQLYNARGYEAAQGLPNIKPLIGNDPTHPFFGRKVVHDFIDGGSFQCPETTTAAAVDIVQNKKPFVVFNNFDGAAYNMAEALHAKAPPDKRPMHFGSLWLSDKDYHRFSPYVWTQFTSGTKAADMYGSYVCSRLVGKKAARSAQYANTTRKFALLYPNLVEARNVGDDLRVSVKKYCGTDIYEGRVFEYSTDLSRAADEGTSIAVRLKLEGVTSLTYLMDPVFPLFQIIAQEGQGYRPEYVWTPTGYYDSSTVQRLYEQKQIDGNSFGVTMFGIPGGFGVQPGDPFFVWHDTHQVSPKTHKKCDPNSDAGMNHDPQYCKAPGAIVTWLYTTLPTIAGVLFAGPNLNPTNVTIGLQHVPSTRYGGNGPTQKPFAALLGAGPGKFYFIVDATEYRWRAGFVSPPPETKIGWVEYPDCQRHYTLWGNGLAPGWAKGSTNYTAYCGSSKYVFSPYAPHGPDNKTCADTPSKTCEKDDYPRWADW